MTEQQSLVDKMLNEGSTFEDVVEAVNEREGMASRSTPSEPIFRETGNSKPSACTAWLKTLKRSWQGLDKDPKSAEARLARATFLTGYSKCTGMPR